MEDSNPLSQGKGKGTKARFSDGLIVGLAVCSIVPILVGILSKSLLLGGFLLIVSWLMLLFTRGCDSSRMQP